MLGVLVAPAALIAAGCGDGGLERPDSGLDPNIPPVTQGNWYRPDVSSTWQWQLQGLVDTGFPLSATDQLAFNRVLSNEAHARDLSVALKNDLDQVRELVDYVDFSVNEQCHEFDECDMLRPFILAGKPIFNAEYADRFVNDPVERQNLCATALAENIRTLILPVELDDSFRFTCEASA